MIPFPTKSSVRAAYYRVVRKGYHYSHKISRALYGRHISIIAILFTLTGCSTTKSINHEPLTINHRDTIYLNTLQYDSIFVSHERSSEYRRGFPSSLTSHPSTLTDTIYIRDVSVEYKYKLLRDTIRLHQVDSIPVIKEVYLPPKLGDRGGLPWWSKALNWIGLAALAAIFVQFVIFVFKLKKL